MEVVLQAHFFDVTARRSVQLGALAAERHIDVIHIAHQFQRVLFADILVQCTAEIIGNIVFAVGESACAAEATHNGTAFAADTGLKLLAVNGTFAFVQLMTRFEYAHLELRILPDQFISGKNSSGACPNDQHVIHDRSSSFISRAQKESRFSIKRTG